MKILVIPDVHLKPWMFEDAKRIMNEGKADNTVCLMDIADGWNQQYNLSLYEATYDKAIEFAREFPDSLWCYGNHDLCYILNQRESGWSPIAGRVVNEKLRKLRETLSNPNQLAIIHKIDDVLFMHGGLTEKYVKENIIDELYDDVDRVVEEINKFEFEDCYYRLWHDESPIWFRPQIYTGDLYKKDEIIQVVGHTPVREIKRDANIISTDNFSTDNRQEHIGKCQFLIINTQSKLLQLL